MSVRWFALVLWLAAVPAGAVEPDEMLADAALEARARAVSATLRCLVCQNQSIDDSNAPLARDLRILVRERLSAGESNEAAIAFVVARYGDFVLLKPPFKPTTWLLWLAPPALLAGGATAGIFYLRRRRATSAAAPLSAAEQAQLARLLDPEEDRAQP